MSEPSVTYYITCDLCGVFASDMFDSREEAKSEAIRIGWLADLPNNGHQSDGWGGDLCVNCGTWDLFWARKDCPLWIVACKSCQASQEDFNELV